MANPECRTCHFTGTVNLGSLPDVSDFAGRKLNLPLIGGALWRCPLCNFVFRHPIYDEATYTSLYRDGSDTVWEAMHARQDVEIIKAHVERLGVVDVLDVGCYTGHLLASLPDRCRRYGVEVNRKAVAVAMSRGVQIIARNFAELAGVEQRFDLIMACDMIEHFADPLSFLRVLGRCLKPGGQLLVTTGNSDSWLWRMARANYWYCHFPEHISFLGRRWFNTVPSSAGFKVDHLIGFSYGPRSYRGIATLVGAVIYALAPAMFCSIRKKINFEKNMHFIPPGCGATKDHVLCVMSAA